MQPRRVIFPCILIQTKRVSSTGLRDAGPVAFPVVPVALKGPVRHLTVHGGLLPLLVGAATTLAAAPCAASASQGGGPPPVPGAVLAAKASIGTVAGPSSSADPLEARAPVHRVAPLAPPIREVPHEVNASGPGAAALARVLVPSAPIAGLARRDSSRVGIAAPRRCAQGACAFASAVPVIQRPAQRRKERTGPGTRRGYRGRASSPINDTNPARP